MKEKRRDNKGRILHTGESQRTDGSEKAEKVFAEYAEQIGQETLAVAVEKAEPAGYVKDWKINGEAVNMGVEKQGE